MHMSSTPTLSLLSLMQISLSLSLFKMLGAERVGQQLGLLAQDRSDIKKIYPKRKEKKLTSSIVITL